MASDESDGHRKADHYRHDDGTDEIVFAAAEGHVLTVREYHSVDDFERAVASAEYVGAHEGVADLPGVDAFEDDPAAGEDDDPAAGEDDDSPAGEDDDSPAGEDDDSATFGNDSEG